MPLTPVVEARADTVMSQAQRIAATIPPTPDALAVPVDVLQTIFAALFALLRRLGPMVLNAILLLNINTLAVPVAALLNDPNLLDPPADSFHAVPGWSSMMHERAQACTLGPRRFVPSLLEVSSHIRACHGPNHHL